MNINELLSELYKVDSSIIEIETFMDQKSDELKHAKAFRNKLMQQLHILAELQNQETKVLGGKKDGDDVDKNTQANLQVTK